MRVVKMIPATIINHVLLLVIGLLLSIMPVSTGYATDAERDRTLIIGKVSPNPKKHYLYLKPIAEYAVSQMQDLGVNKVKVLMAKNNQQMVRYLKRGKVDWVTETIFSAIEFEEKAQAEIFLLKHKKGVATYHTVFFSRKDSNIESFADLKGKVITFEDKGSTSGFYIPAALMLDAGLELVELESLRDRISGEQVGFVFAKAEINMSTWVNKRLVDAGAYANLDWDKEDHNPTAFRDSMHIFSQSPEYPRAIELVRKDLRPEIKQRLKAVLLAAHQDPKAKAALKAYQKTTRFDLIDENIRAAIEHAKSIRAIVKNDLEL